MRHPNRTAKKQYISTGKPISENQTQEYHGISQAAASLQHLFVDPETTRRCVENLHHSRMARPLHLVQVRFLVRVPLGCALSVSLPSKVFMMGF